MTAGGTEVHRGRPPLPFATAQACHHPTFDTGTVSRATTCQAAEVAGPRSGSSDHVRAAAAHKLKFNGETAQETHLPVPSAPMEQSAARGWRDHARAHCGPVRACACDVCRNGGCNTGLTPRIRAAASAAPPPMCVNVWLPSYRLSRERERERSRDYAHVGSTTAHINTDVFSNCFQLLLVHHPPLSPNARSASRKPRESWNRAHQKRNHGPEKVGCDRGEQRCHARLPQAVPYHLPCLGTRTFENVDRKVFCFSAHAHRHYLLFEFASYLAPSLVRWLV